MGGAGAHLSHVDLGSLLEHGGAGHVETLLQPVEPQRLHLLVAALHLEGVVCQLGQLLHVLWGSGDLSRGPRSRRPCRPPARPGPEDKDVKAGAQSTSSGPGERFSSLPGHCVALGKWLPLSEPPIPQPHNEATVSHDL